MPYDLVPGSFFATLAALKPHKRKEAIAAECKLRGTENWGRYVAVPLRSEHFEGTDAQPPGMLLYWTVLVPDTANRPGVRDNGLPREIAQIRIGGANNPRGPIEFINEDLALDFAEILNYAKERRQARARNFPPLPPHQEPTWPTTF